MSTSDNGSSTVTNATRPAKLNVLASLEGEDMRKTAAFRPVRIFATKATRAWEANRLWLEHPENRRFLFDQIAPGFTPDSTYDMTNFGGKTIPNLTFQCFYVSGATNGWSAGDTTAIDNALSSAFADWKLNSVMSQYFSQTMTASRVSSQSLTATLDTYHHADIESFVQARYSDGTLSGDFTSTVFCFLLAPGVRLYSANDSEDSHNGLGGYHGSIDVPRTGGGGTVRVYYAVGVYSQVSQSFTNGIVIFTDSWKNVVATFYHELNEARTDSDVELATSSTSSVLGWYSASYGEVGDIPMDEAANNLSSVILEVVLADGSGTVPVQLMYSNRDHGPSQGLGNGDLLRETNGAIWVIFNGARFHVPDMATLARLFGGIPITQVPDGGVEGMPLAPVDWTLLREETGAIWVVFGQAKFLVPDMPTLNRLYGGRPIFQLWDGAPDQIATAPVDWTLLREETGAIWVVFGQAKFLVPDMPTLNRLYGGRPIFQLWDGSVDGLPLIPADGTLLREESNTQVYVVQNGHKAPAPANSTGVDIVWDGALQQIP